MSLPDGFLDELRTRISISQVVGRKVMWDMRKSNQGKGDMWAPCPFHQEKSASFHVDDRKGFYYCFGCHAKGDALTFVRETENVGFMEAVEILAREAGMQMPARDPRAAQKADRRSELADVMEEAVKYFRMMLSTGAGQGARDYLAGRRLGPKALDRFEIGFAPDARQGLFQALSNKGIAAEKIVDAGLCAKPDDGGAPYDRFRGRIIYPIRDQRGRCIAFGGRAMDPNARAKYLNSPETALFDKGRSLYNHGPAREACGKGARLVVSEGYMDVIALVEAGFGGAVAPLGTAITETQLQLLWRIHDEPIIALDGDTAGIRAAMRLIDLSLPLLEAGKGLRIAMLPGGQDPDDLLKASGYDAMEQVLAQAKPMVDLLWQRETEGKQFDSPERKAALDKSLRAAISKIRDPSIRSHYGHEIKEKRLALFGQGRSFDRGGYSDRGFGGPYQAGGARRGSYVNGKWTPALSQPLAQTRNSMLAMAEDAAVAEHLRAAMVLAICLTHPTLIAEHESQLFSAPLSDPFHDDLRNRMLRHLDLPPDDLLARLHEDMGRDLETLLNLPHVRSAPPVMKRADTALARMCLMEELAKLDAERAVRAEVEDAKQDLEGLADEGVTWRLSQATRRRQNANSSKITDTSDMGEDREALSALLQSAIDQQIWRKKK
ncbi:DNA primase [Thioclava sp. SK-1]|uniref:DNA primase n=1 Tax=Thioclava sp. SK-1 TaxID=1889770 RepID=UPI00082609CC|nr:DNA primase [Thioclava sp. SK-1]OCX66623.1 DNA primase [Thioclava sp. SK-1]